jgi:negative regulator of sigma-B (phosphoserine phosphatase)
VRLAIEHVTLPKEGEEVSGDAAYTCVEEETALLAIVDALGHGPHAAEVADLAMSKLATLSTRTPVADSMADLDRHLRGSRGAAVLLCRFEGHEVEMCSIGNVEARGVHRPFPLVLTAGIVGTGRAHRLRVCKARLESGHRLLLFTDGVSARFDLDVAKTGGPREICKNLLAKHRRPHDDATLMVVDMENEQ